MNLFVATIFRILMQIAGNWLAAKGIDAASLLDSDFIQVGAGLIIVAVSTLWSLRVSQILTKRGVKKVRLRPKPGFLRKRPTPRDPADATVQSDLRKQVDEDAH